uniref:Uncharacterized protein n=1 Tax=Arundo donax TaxID=35708 RepID=A0A0A9HJT1_ARUDO
MPSHQSAQRLCWPPPQRCCCVLLLEGLGRGGPGHRRRGSSRGVRADLHNGEGHGFVVEEPIVAGRARGWPAQQEAATAMSLRAAVGFAGGAMTAKGNGSRNQ